ncbi:hypothetical protein J437_LFUL018000 [Ladona fulva]|uniref:Reverse transcriptase domain-containing protein n=1 Tax=Ladona fulva TaxID=123851 RepID=A0A8K0KMS8_LADFU|nr:hypothetical protein J437_LFUL018000 [Ladona fulva]
MCIMNRLLKTCSSRGIDGVSNHVVKVIHASIAPIFTFIVNLSMETGVFPEQLKTAVVIPVHKKRDKLDVNNFRPISLLPVFSKILKKIGIFIDIKNAFDTVDHILLFERLHEAGIRVTYNWFRSYSSGGTQMVKIKYSFSDNSNFFCNDTSLCYAGLSNDHLHKIMQTDLDRLSLWFTFNKTVLSPKTKYLLISLNKQSIPVKNLL